MHPCTRILATIGMFLAAACTNTGARLSETVAPLRVGVQQADEQTALAFSQTNDMAKELNIKRVIGQNAKNLREADFPQAIAYEERDKWQAAFGALDSYLVELQKLVDPARSAQTTTELDALAAQLRDGRTQIKLPGATVAAFNSLAGALVQASAERKAVAVMQRTDPAFNEVVSAMAEAIGPADTAGLRQTVRAYWETKLAEIRADYSETAKQPGSESSRRELIRQFTESMNARDEQLRDLAALRSSLLALGEAHGAAARGNNGDALFWVNRIAGWVDQAKERAKAAADKDAERKGEVQ